MVERILFTPGGATESKQDNLLSAVGDVATADTVRELLARIYSAVDGLELSADTVNLAVDGVEGLLDEIKAKATELDAAFDAEDFAQDATLSDLVSRIGDTATAGTVRELLLRVYNAVDGLELSVDNIDLQTDSLEAKSDALKAALEAAEAARDADATSLQSRADLLATEATLAGARDQIVSELQQKLEPGQAITANQGSAGGQQWPVVAGKGDRVLLDYAGRSDGKPVYLGIAPQGTPTSSAAWRVIRLSWDDSGLRSLLTDKQEFVDAIYDDRTTLSWAN